MILPDVNVLIYAFRRDVPQHALCRSWLDRVVAEESAFGISPLALSAVVRETTSPRSYVLPEPLHNAFGFCQELLNQPHCRIVEPGAALVYFRTGLP